MTDDDAELLPIRSRELRKILPLSPTQLYRELKAGRLTAVKLASRTFISRAEAKRYIASLPRIGAA